MADPKEPTKAELAEALLNATQMLKDQGALIANQGREIAELKAAPQAVRTGAFNYSTEPTKKGYFGWVKATQSCQVNRSVSVDGKLQVQAIVYAPGDVFQHDVDQLWSDDPFEAVEVTGYEDHEQNKPITKPNKEAVVMDRRFRVHARLMDDAQLRAASQY